MKYYLFASGVYLLASVIVVPLAVICGAIIAVGSAREFWRGISEGLAEYKANQNQPQPDTSEVINELETSNAKPMDIWDRHIARMNHKKQSEGK